MEHGVGEAAGLLANVVHVGEFGAEFYFFAEAVFEVGVAVVDVVLIVLAPAVGFAVLVEAEVAELADGAADGVVGTEKSEATGGVAAFNFYFFVFGGAAKLVVEHASELGAVLEGGGSANDVDFLNGFERRIVIGLGIAEGVGGYIDSVLADVEFPTAVGAEPPAGYVDLDAGCVAFPNGDAGYFAKYLAGGVGDNVGIGAVQVDDVALFGGVDGLAVNVVGMGKGLLAAGFTDDNVVKVEGFALGGVCRVGVEGKEV